MVIILAFQIAAIGKVLLVSSGALLYNLTGQSSGDFFGYSNAGTNNFLLIGANGYPSGSFKGPVFAYIIISGALLYNLTDQNNDDTFGSSMCVGTHCISF